MRSRLPLALLVALITLLGGVLAGTGSAGATVVRGHGVSPWPDSTLQLGVMSSPEVIAAQRAQAPFGFAYAYLSGGVNTGNGWASWDTGEGSYAGEFIADCEAAGVVPVFSYYQIRQSNPGAGASQESQADLENIDDRSTMLAYYNDLKLFFQQAATAAGPVVLQVEPDLWGYIEDAAKHDNASSVPASVASSGMPDLAGMPNTAAGLAQAIIVLRNNYAPKVILAYHDSSWGTGKDIQSSHPTTAVVRWMAGQSVAFYRSLHAHFDAVFTEMSNMDAGYAQEVEGQGTSQWWSATDFAHLGLYVRLVHRALGVPMVLWQIPVGLTTMHNTYEQYEDNKIQSLLDAGPTARALLRSYANDGVSAILFGPAQANDDPVSATTLSEIAKYYGRGVLHVG